NRDVICSYMFEDYPPNLNNWRIEGDVLKSIADKPKTEANLICDDAQKIIKEVQFVGYGNPWGSCGSYMQGTCQAPNAKKVVEKACLGKNSCKVPLDRATLGEPTGDGDYDRYMRDYEAYQHFVALCEHEVGGSSSGPTRRRTYIPREREDAKQRLMDDYFGDDEFLRKYPEENFRRRYRMSSTLFNKINILSYDVESIPEYFSYFRQRYDATGRLSIGHILKCTSAIRQLAYGTTPDAFDEYLRIVEHTSRE
ncbi:beta-galactosidase 13-like protein, partial [Tanacetum coccineum]